MDTGNRHLADLVHHWGSVFTISVCDGKWTARARNRANGRALPGGVTLRDDTAAGLREQIRSEYFRLTRLRPVR
jgi:hypothetical protein